MGILLSGLGRIAAGLHSYGTVIEIMKLHFEDNCNFFVVKKEEFLKLPLKERIEIFRLFPSR